MLTPAEFNELPPLVRYSTLLRCGFTDEAIAALAFEVSSEADPVPSRRIGCLRLPTKRAHNNGGLGRRFFRRADLVQFIGPEFQRSVKTVKALNR